MPRQVVRFYRTNMPASLVIPAVLHRTNCYYALRRALEPGETLQMPDGWWEAFASEVEAREAAERFHTTRRTPDSRITESPGCCP